MTTSQTVGPFSRIGLQWLYRDRLFADGTRGVARRVSGRILDGEGRGVDGATIELWQANPQGRYPSPLSSPCANSKLEGFGRIEASADGAFGFHTLKPGALGADQAPHMLVAVFARGLLRHLVTRMYFPDEGANDGDHVLGSLETGRRETLIARCGDDSPDHLLWDIVLQGPAETVFFDC